MGIPIEQRSFLSPYQASQIKKLGFMMKEKGFYKNPPPVNNLKKLIEKAMRPL